jgi:hypothetical protein
VKAGNLGFEIAFRLKERIKRETYKTLEIDERFLKVEAVVRNNEVED